MPEYHNGKYIGQSPLDVYAATNGTFRRPQETVPEAPEVKPTYSEGQMHRENGLRSYEVKDYVSARLELIAGYDCYCRSGEYMNATMCLAQLAISERDAQHIDGTKWVLEKALEVRALAEVSENEDLARTYFQLGHTYYEARNFDESIAFFGRAKKLAERLGLTGLVNNSETATKQVNQWRHLLA